MLGCPVTIVISGWGGRQSGRLRPDALAGHLPGRAARSTSTPGARTPARGGAGGSLRGQFAYGATLTHETGSRTRFTELLT